jgi:Entner-Doudoroff aldolase
MTPSDFVAALRESHASAIVRTSTKDAAAKAMDAAIKGGFKVCEFTLTVPNAFDLIKDFAAHKDLIIGAGTVLTIDDARRAVNAGAKFLVSPIVDPAVIAEAIRLNVAIMPGCSTPTEMLQAHRAGAPLQKLFPAPANGPQWVAQTLAPLPFLRIVPTAGVTLENAPAYLRAGAWAVGFVSSLFDPADIAAGRYEAIESRARQMLEAAHSA